MVYNRYIGIIFSMALILLITGGCSEDSTPVNQENKLNFKISVFSDPHYFAPELFAEGDALENNLRGSRKMLMESEAILKSAISRVKSINSQIVLIPGDLTKDGEKLSHQKFADNFRELKNSGKKVYVIPGNHDVANPESKSYIGVNVENVESVTPAEFRQIYADFGYNEALYKDENSLSYVAEPIEGLWIIAMDACRYNENTDRHTVGGKFNNATLNWIYDRIKEGKSKGKLMIGMNHHGVLEHFTGQKSNPVTTDYVIDDYRSISEEFAKNGLNFVFTGHFHANDIVSANYDKNFIYDIETGSLVTYPVPIRTVEVINSEQINISTELIDNVDYQSIGSDFQVYAYNYLKNDLSDFVEDILVSQFSLQESVAAQFAPIGINAFVAHYAGDEVISKEAVDLINEYKGNNNITIQLLSATIQTLYTDMNPEDNNLRINMITGAVIR